MSAVSTQTLYTPEDLLRMPDGDRYELIDGQLVEHSMSAKASYVAGRILNNLSNYCKQEKAGWPFPEGVTYQCFADAPNKVRKADVSFMALARFSIEDYSEEGHIQIAPDLAVEVISPNDTLYEVDRKVREFLGAGVRLVWVVNPDVHTVTIHRAKGAPSILNASDTITGEEVLPSFSCLVGDFFLTPTGLLI